MNVIFSKHDFSLCEIPVTRGYPQSQTHVGVFYYKEHVYLTSSPFPNIPMSLIETYFKASLRKLTKGILYPLKRGESFENPFLYVSCNNNYTKFKLMQNHPLMEQPEENYGYPSFNSDPDLYVENGNIYVINRVVYRTKLTPEKKRDEYIIRYYMIHGAIDKHRFKLLEMKLFNESDLLSVSPCMTKYRGNYILTNLYSNCYNDGEDFQGLKYVKSDSIDKLLYSKLWKTIEINTSEYIPWHMSLFVHKDTLYTIVACVKRGIPKKCYQMLGVFSDDLSQLSIFKGYLTDYNSYRGSAYISENDEFHLYSTTVNENISGGKSVDGREVIYTHINFYKLLNKLREYEDCDTIYRQP